MPNIDIDTSTTPITPDTNFFAPAHRIDPRDARRERDTFALSTGAAPTADYDVVVAYTSGRNLYFSVNIDVNQSKRLTAQTNRILAGDARLDLSEPETR